MSNDNVTPIRGGSPADPPAKRPRPPRVPKKCSRFHLAQPEFEPDNMRLIHALHGVCRAIEARAEIENSPPPLELGTAAEILSNMLMDRIDYSGD